MTENLDDFNMRVEIDDNSSAEDVTQIIYHTLYERLKNFGSQPDEIFLSTVLYERMKDHCTHKTKREMKSNEELTFMGPKGSIIIKVYPS